MFEFHSPSEALLAEHNVFPGNFPSGKFGTFFELFLAFKVKSEFNIEH